MMRFLPTFLALVFLVIVSPTLAQSEDPPSPAERLKEFLKEKAENRPQFRPPAVGQVPRRILTAKVDWAAVRRVLEQGPPGPLPPPPGLTVTKARDLPGVRRREVRRVLIPILIPSDEQVQETVEIFGQINSYTAIAQAGEGVALRVSGSRKSLLLPASPPERLRALKDRRPPLPKLGARYVITRSDTSTDLSFSRFGCGYVLSLICDDPDGDARCAEDGFIEELASAMALVHPGSVPDEEPSSDEAENPDTDSDTTETTQENEDEPSQASLPPSEDDPQETETGTPAQPEDETDETDETAPLSDDAGNTFAYLPAGEILPQSGPGFEDATIYRPDIAFPTEDNAYLNSQVYRYGGYYGHLNGMEGGQCNPENYAYPWQDTFCEKRSREQPMCPGGGHEGLDIRPASCEKDAHWAVAVEDARVIDVRRHWVTLQTDDGTLYNYLHLNMEKLRVELGDDVQKGDRLGLISNDFYKSDGSSVPTTIHLHFEMYENYVAEEDDEPLFTKVNPYTTLVHAYDRKLRE